MTVRNDPAPNILDQAVDVQSAARQGVMLTVSCFISYWLITHILSSIHSISHSDDLLGGMWAVVATVFVYRTSYHQSIIAARSRMGATLASFVLCLLYLLVFPFHPAGLAVLIGIGAFLLIMLGRSEEVVTAGITTAVVMVAAALSPHDAWQQPILRLVDTVVGTAVGVLASAIGGRLPAHTGTLPDHSAGRDRRVPPHPADEVA